MVMPDEVYWRHDNWRKAQKEMVDDILDALNKKQHILCHAPTGMGKTDASLSAAISYALANDLEVMFVTPKKSQHKMAMQVVDGLRAKYNLDFEAVDFVGRKDMCVNEDVLELDNRDFYDVCQMLRTNTQKKEADLVEGGYCKPFKEGMCPYTEAMRRAANARVIIADYSYVFVPWISKVFLNATKKLLINQIIIVDEAHNLRSRLLGALSYGVRSGTFSKALDEMKLLKQHYKDEKFRTFHKWANMKLKGEVEVKLTEKEIKGFFGEIDVAKLIDIGKRWIYKGGKRSACLRIGEFFSLLGTIDDTYFTYLRRHENGYRMEIKCLDVSRVIGIANKAYAMIGMSGTFYPLNMYRDLFGLERERTILKTYRSPFNAENRLNLLYTGATTLYEKRGEQEYSKIGGVISRCADATKGNVGVFFPSYEVLDGVISYITTNRKMFVQRPDMKKQETEKLINEFKSGSNGMLIGVQGGSLSEGVDYDNGSLKCAIIVGVALDHKSLEVSETIRLYDKLYLGKGKEYGYFYPAVNKAMQTAGRVIRKEDDRGVVVFIDKRFEMKCYREGMPDDLVLWTTSNPEYFIKEFFDGKR